MKQNEANMWNKEMSLAQILQMVAGSFFVAIALAFQSLLYCFFTLELLPIESKQADDPTQTHLFS